MKKMLIALLSLSTLISPVQAAETTKTAEVKDGAVIQQLLQRRHKLQRKIRRIEREADRLMRYDKVSYRNTLKKTHGVRLEIAQIDRQIDFLQGTAT